jgi:ribonuclease HI
LSTTAKFLLPAGERVIQLYGDASYLSEVTSGTWAYQIPTLGLREFGLEADTWTERLELLAIVKGLEAVAAVDFSGRDIHVHTDSTFVLSVMRYLSNLQTLPPRRSFVRVRDLLLQGTAALEGRQVQSFQIKGKVSDHHVCHLEARRHLREQVWEDLQFGGYAALKRAERKFAMLQGKYERLNKQIEKTRRELSIADAEVRALRQFNGA